MSLLDDLAKGVASALSGQQTGGLANAVLSSLQSQGGIDGLVRRFNEAGLGDVVASWISSGQNLPISAEQLQQVLGRGSLATIAEQAGLSADQGLGALTKLLPQLIDGLTPSGQAPAPGTDLIGAGLDLLKRLNAG